MAITVPDQTAGSTSRTTAGGTANTKYAATPPASTDPLILITPNSVTPSSPVDVVFVLHGHNDDQNTMDMTRFTAMRDGLLDAGYLLVAPYAHGNNWGNAQSQSDLSAALAWLSGFVTVRRVLILAQSMGSSTAMQAVARHTIPAVAAVLVSPAVNLRAMYDLSSTYATTIRAAYGVVTDGSDYAAKTAGWDVVLRNGSDFAGISVRMYSSPDDTVTVKANHADVLAPKLSGNARILDRIVASGEHLTSDHYRPAEVVAFFSRAITLADQGRPVSSTISVWNGTAWVQASVKRWNGVGWVDDNTQAFTI